MKNKRVVITGIGPISSNGIGKSNFWDGLINRRLNIKKVNVNIGGEAFESFYKHRLSGFKLSDFPIDPLLLKDLFLWKGTDKDIDLNILLAAISLALTDSNLQFDKEKNSIGLIVSHENPGLEQYFSHMLNISYNYFQGKSGKKTIYLKYLLTKLMKSSYELQTFMPLYHIGKIFSFHGYSLFINNACASGAFALEEASRVIHSGKCPLVFVVSGDYPNFYKYLWFKAINMYSKKGFMSPFSENADGFIMGEGGAALVLEDYEHARKRKAPIYAEYLAGGFNFDGWKVSIPNIKQKFYKKAILESLTIADIKANDLDLIIPHGVSTRLMDAYEISIFTEILGKTNKRTQITALKPYFGHNLGGNVLLEIAALMMMFTKNKLLPTLNFNSSETHSLNFIKEVQNKEIQIALKSTSAFAGFNSSLIFRNLN